MLKIKKCLTKYAVSRQFPKFTELLVSKTKSKHELSQTITVHVVVLQLRFMPRHFSQG